MLWTSSIINRFRSLKYVDGYWVLQGLDRKGHVLWLSQLDVPALLPHFSPFLLVSVADLLLCSSRWSDEKSGQEEMEEPYLMESSTLDFLPHSRDFWEILTLPSWFLYQSSPCLFLEILLSLRSPGSSLYLPLGWWSWLPVSHVSSLAWT